MGEAQRFYDLFTMFYAPEDILLFPAREYIFYNFESYPDPGARAHRRAEQAARGPLQGCARPGGRAYAASPAGRFHTGEHHGARGGRALSARRADGLPRAGPGMRSPRSPRARASFRTAAGLSSSFRPTTPIPCAWSCSETRSTACPFTMRRHSGESSRPTASPFSPYSKCSPLSRRAR